MMYGQLITKGRRDIMKKSSLYFIYGLLFTIIANTAENRLAIGLMAINAVLYLILSGVMYYFENKDN